MCCLQWCSNIGRVGGRTKLQLLLLAQPVALLASHDPCSNLTSAPQQGSRAATCGGSLGADARRFALACRV